MYGHKWQNTIVNKSSKNTVAKIKQEERLKGIQFPEGIDRVREVNYSNFLMTYRFLAIFNLSTGG